jgi:eukaryotic-like serine/threonine-protein kinase
VVVAYSGGNPKLWVRPTARPEWQALAGTEGGTLPFWSPDSQSIGFFANNELKTVRLSGGLPIALCAARDFYGISGAWNRKDVILFADVQGLHRVLSRGGTPTAVTVLAKGETGHLWPSFFRCRQASP